MKTTDIYNRTVETGTTNKSAKHNEAPVKKAEELTETAEIIYRKIQHRFIEANNKLEKIDFNN